MPEKKDRINAILSLLYTTITEVAEPTVAIRATVVIVTNVPNIVTLTEYVEQLSTTVVRTTNKYLPQEPLWLLNSPRKMRLDNFLVDNNGRYVPLGFYLERMRVALDNVATHIEMDYNESYAYYYQSNPHRLYAGLNSILGQLNDLD